LKVLVTGGAGFIGSNFIRYLLRTRPDCTVINLDKLTYAGNLANLADVESDSNYRFQQGDICDGATVEKLMQGGVDAVVHFAAETHVDRSIADARAFVETNVQGTYSLLNLARRHRVARFVHVSTDEVYGSLAAGEKANENSPLAPNSPYAASKAAADLLARSFWRTYRFPVIVARPSNNYGPFQFPEKLIPLMICNALEGKKLPLYGDGMNERDWVFVEDHCRALDLILQDGRPGETYNIGTGAAVTNLSVVRSLPRLLGGSEDLIEFVADRPGHDRRYALDATKIARELGWKPEVDLEEGLRRTVEWYRVHPQWVEGTKSGEYRDYYEKFYVHRRATLAQT
jgi:dTDP-glucose 4,6-dehydratase